MGIKERKEREKASRRKEILKAARKIILKRGVEGMSMNEVADLTELNKATLYLYFSSKEDLIDALVCEGLTMLESELQHADRPSLSGLGKVSSLMKRTFVFYKRNPAYFYTLNHQERRKPGERLNTPHSLKGDEIAGRIFTRFRESLRQGIADGSIRKDVDIERLPILIYALTFGVMHTIFSKQDIYEDVLDADPETIERSALELLEHFLA